MNVYCYQSSLKIPMGCRDEKPTLCVSQVQFSEGICLDVFTQILIFSYRSTQERYLMFSHTLLVIWGRPTDFVLKRYFFSVTLVNVL